MTRVPQNGGSGTSASSATSERAVASPSRDGRYPAGPQRAADLPGPALGQLRPGLAALDRHHRVHQPQALERVPRVPDLALEQRAPGPARRRRGSARRRPAGSGQRCARPREFSSARLSRITTVDLTSSPDMPIASAPGLLGGVDDRGDRLLDADVDHVVAVVGQDDVDQVLADVVHVALDRGQHDRALAAVVGPSPCAVPGTPTALFITSADASTNGSCICPDPNSSPTVFMPSSRVSLTISSAGRWSRASSRSASRPLRSPSMMRRFSRSHSGSAASSSARLSLTAAMSTPSNSSRKRRQRVVVRAAPVVDQVEGHLPLLVRDPGHRHDPGRRARWPSRARPATHSARNTELSTARAAGLEPERHVGDAERRLHVRGSAA